MNSQNQLLDPGHIILCRYPFTETPAIPGRATRPCLIVATGKEYGLNENTLVVAKISSRAAEPGSPLERFYIPLKNRIYNEHLMPVGAVNNHLVLTQFMALPVNYRFFPEGMISRGQVDAEISTLASDHIMERKTYINLRPLGMTHADKPRWRGDGRGPSFICLKEGLPVEPAQDQAQRPSQKRISGRYLRFNQRGKPKNFD